MPDTSPRPPVHIVVVVTTSSTCPGHHGATGSEVVVRGGAGKESTPPPDHQITIVVVVPDPPPLPPGHARGLRILRGGEGLAALGLGMHINARSPLEWLGEWALGELVNLAIELGVPALVHLAT